MHKVRALRAHVAQRSSDAFLVFVDAYGHPSVPLPLPPRAGGSTKPLL